MNTANIIGLMSMALIYAVSEKIKLRCSFKKGTCKGMCEKMKKMIRSRKEWERGSKDKKDVAMGSKRGETMCRIPWIMNRHNRPYTSSQVAKL